MNIYKVSNSNRCVQYIEAKTARMAVITYLSIADKVWHDNIQVELICKKSDITISAGKAQLS